MKTLIIALLLLQYNFNAHAESVEEGRFIGVHTGYGMSSSDLTGTGFNAKLPSKGSVIYGGEISYQATGSDTQFSLKHDRTSYSMNAPTGVTPTSLTGFREDTRLMVTVAPWEGSLENLRLGFGYGVLRTGATDTATYNVMNKQTSQGPMFNIANKWKFKSDWSLQSELLLYLPHRVIESPQITGNNGQMLGAEAKISIEYLVSENILAFIGASYRMDRATYSGSETRGVTDGVDTRTYIAIPVGLKIGY